MKITKNNLKRMIKEELSKALSLREYSEKYDKEMLARKNDSERNMPVAEQNIQKVKSMLEDAGFEITYAGELRIETTEWRGHDAQMVPKDFKGKLAMPGMTASKDGDDFSILPQDRTDANTVYTFNRDYKRGGGPEMHYKLSSPDSIKRIQKILDTGSWAKD